MKFILLAVTTLTFTACSSFKVAGKIQTDAGTIHSDGKTVTVTLK